MVKMLGPQLSKTTLITLILLSTALTRDCLPEVKDCIDCDSDNVCVECLDTYFLNITKRPFTCVPCPQECQRCNSAGCAECVEGYFKTTYKNFEVEEFVCHKCDESCQSCDEERTLCTSCPEYYALTDSRTCVFKYTRLVAIGIITIVMLLMLMMFLVAKCICLEKSPEKEEYDNILDKDNELLSDHYKTARDEIGVGQSAFGSGTSHDDSIISNVQPMGEESYLNITNVSTDPIYSTLLRPPTENIQINSKDGDGEFEPGSASMRDEGDRVRGVTMGI